MSHTNETPNFHLPQFTAMDKPDWLVDVNDAFQAIDTGMASTQSEAESATSTAQLAQTTAEGAAETAGQASSDVAGLTTDLETLQGTVNTITALIGNGTPTTTDKTIIGAINEINAKVTDQYVEITADGVKTVKQVMEDLHALIDFSKITGNSRLERHATNGQILVHNCLRVVPTGTTSADYTFVEVLGAYVNATTYHIAASASKLYASTAASATTFTDQSATTDGAGMKYRLYY